MILFWCQPPRAVLNGQTQAGHRKLPDDLHVASVSPFGNQFGSVGQLRELAFMNEMLGDAIHGLVVHLLVYVFREILGEWGLAMRCAGEGEVEVRIQSGCIVSWSMAQFT